MWFSKAEGGLEDVVDVARSPPAPPLEDDLENGLLAKSEAADFTLPVLSSENGGGRFEI